MRLSLCCTKRIQSPPGIDINGSLRALFRLGLECDVMLEPFFSMCVVFSSSFISRELNTHTMCVSMCAQYFLSYILRVLRLWILDHSMHSMYIYYLRMCVWVYVCLNSCLCNGGAFGWKIDTHWEWYEKTKEEDDDGNGKYAMIVVLRWERRRVCANMCFVCLALHILCRLPLCASFLSDSISFQ